MATSKGDEGYRLLDGHSDSYAGPLQPPADVIIVLPWNDKGTKEYDVLVNGHDFATDVFIDEKLGAKEMAKLNEACKSSSVKVGDLARAFAQDLFTWTPKKGFNCKPFLSADGNELFIRISLDDDNVAKFYAEKMGVRLQLTRDAVKALGIEQPIESSPPFIPYDADIVEEMKQFIDEDRVFRKFYTKFAEKGSIIRVVERVRMFETLIDGLIKMGPFFQHAVVQDRFPVHYKSTVNHLGPTWGNFSCKYLFDPTAKFNENAIRDYFGEKIAFYFVWVSFTIRMLVPYAICGVMVKAYGLWRREDQMYEIAAWSTITICWAALYMSKWRSAQHEWISRWDSSVKSKTLRPGFHGTLQASPLNANVQTRQFSNTKRELYVIFSVVMTCVFIGVVLGCVGVIFFFRPMFVARFGKNALTAASIAIAIQIKIFNFIWDFVSLRLTRLENSETIDGFVGSLSSKVFAFQFVNTYNSFLYIGLFQKNRGIGCVGNNCITELDTALMSTYGSAVALAMVGCAVPWMQMSWSLRKEAKSTLAKYQADIDAGRKQLKDLPQRCYMEKQASMLPYGDEELMTDYLSLVLNLGQVFLFGSVSPLLALLCLLLFLLRFRVDAWKLLHVYQKPFAHQSYGIGAWNQMIDLVAWMGVFTTVAIPIVNLNYFDHLPIAHKLTMAFGIEHLFIFLKIMWSAAIPTETSSVELMLRRREYVVERVMLGKQSQMNVSQVIKREMPIPEESSLRSIDQFHPEWKHIDTDAGAMAHGGKCEDADHQ
eukprot:TRINITY_DN1911_c0_g1_i1.p1 TRINITY_DN1911_c0_g1~~TRINITY_DN1911_c0_g1_i1.p1  ORF type:complete len:767 (-),score=85.10 TRINITY_DN1911_c0_g1_i1:231-2531(-)